MSTATLPVETGEYLVIELLDDDPELPCVGPDGQVATHQLRTGCCPPHPLCLIHAQDVIDMLRRASGLGAIDWRCYLHHVDVKAPARALHVEPLNQGGRRRG